MVDRSGVDWAAFVARPTSHTIAEAFRTAGLGRPDFAVEQAIRAAIAEELEKKAHRWRTRSSLSAPDNIAYDLEYTAAQIRSWKPNWVVTLTDDRTGKRRRFEFGTDEDAARAEAAILEDDPDITARATITVDYE